MGILHEMTQASNQLINDTMKAKVEEYKLSKEDTITFKLGFLEGAKAGIEAVILLRGV